MKRERGEEREEEETLQLKPPIPHFQIQMISKAAPESYDAMEDGKEAHWEVVERILFLYAKLNPGIGYIQGMNEIIGPIYFIMASDPSLEYRGQWCSSSVTISSVNHHHPPPLPSPSRTRRSGLVLLLLGIDG